MTLSVATRIPTYGDGLTYAAQDDRLRTALLLTELGNNSGSNTLGIGSGVRVAAGSPLKVSVASGLSVTVNTGCAAIQGSAALNSGAYTVVLDSTATLTCTAADTVNPRIDAVCLTVTDNGDNTSTSVVQIVTGTPASSPSAPSLPANSLRLANITVAANASTLSSGNISDQRQFLAATGGIKRVLSSAFYPTAGDSSQYLHDANQGRMKWWSGSSVQAPKVAAFAPAFDGPHTVSATGTAQTVAAATVTVDGSTNVEVSFTYNYISSAGTGAGNACSLNFMRGSTNLRTVVKTCAGPDQNIDGGTITIVDRTPAASTYAYSVTVANQGAGTYAVQAGSIVVKAISS
jgi:hypothetical protein